MGVSSSPAQVKLWDFDYTVKRISPTPDIRGKTPIQADLVSFFIYFSEEKQEYIIQKNIQKPTTEYVLLPRWLSVAGLLLSNGPQDSFQSRSAEYAPVKYGGPIVYSGEKPPIIHFPPPPRDTQSYGGGGKGGGSPPSIKYVPLPHHDLPVLIYTSDSQPPIHVVHTPRPHIAKTNYQEEEKPVYKKRA